MLFITFSLFSDMCKTFFTSHLPYDKFGVFPGVMPEATREIKEINICLTITISISGALFSLIHYQFLVNMRKNNRQMDKVLKYRILEILKTFPRADEEQLKISIPEQLAMAPTTFRDLCYVKCSSGREFSGSQTIQIAGVLNVGVIELFTFPPAPLSKTVVDPKEDNNTYGLEH